MEIEKKYLCKLPDFDLSAYKRKEIAQYYISTDPTIRIRKADSDFFLTVKGKGHIARDEFEMPISESQFESLVKKTDMPPVSKTRYFIPLDNGLTAELDIYHSSLHGLVTVEVEFESLEDADSFIPPLWFGKDVSEDKRYKNASLYTKGMP